MSEKRPPFTDFLVERGIISNDIILELLIEQYRKIPSTIEIVVGKKLLPIYKIFKVFKNMDNFGFDFQKTAESLKHWSDDLQAGVEKERKKYKLPIGQIIVRKKLASTKQMVTLLEEYNNLKYGEYERTQGMMLDIEVQKIDTANFEVEFLAIDEDSLTDYLSTVDGEKRNEIEHKIINWEKLCEAGNREKEFEENINFVYREYHTIKGSSRFIRAQLIGKIVHLAEDLLSAFKEKYKDIPKTTVEALSNLNLIIMDIVWDILDCLYKNKSEEPYWEVKGNQEKVKDVINNIYKLKDEIC